LYTFFFCIGNTRKYIHYLIELIKQIEIAVDRLVLKQNIIIILIDGGRLDRAKNSPAFGNLKSQSVFFSQVITYAPYTTASLHALLSGCYGNRTGTNSYWHSCKFKTTKFKTMVKYLKENGYYTYGDGHSDLILANHGFDEFDVHDEEKTDLLKHHIDLLEKMKVKNEKGTSFFSLFNLQ